MLQIGKYRVFHEGGRWMVVHDEEIISEHHNKWSAIQTARTYSWRDIHEKKRPPVVTSGPQEPKSKWRRAI